MVEAEPPKCILDALEKFNGMEPRLIIAEKVLFASDVKHSQARLMLPANKVLSQEFLRTEEIRILEGSTKETRKEGVSAIFVDPDLKTYAVSLKQWKKNMVLSRWTPVLDSYNFKEGEKFSLWSFRCEETLYLALVPKDEYCGYLDVFSHLDFMTLNDVDVFSLLNLFHFPEEYADVNALPDLGSFEDTDVVASYYDDA